MSVKVPKDFEPADLTIRGAQYDAVQKAWLPSNPLNVHENWWVDISKEKVDQLTSAGMKLHEVGPPALQLTLWYK